MSEESLIISVDDAYKIFKESAKATGSKIVATLFIPTTSLEGVLKLKAFNRVPIRAITMKGMTRGHANTIRIMLPNQPPSVVVRRYTLTDKFLVAVKNDAGLTHEELEKIYDFSLTLDVSINVQRTLVECGEKLYEFRSFRPKGVENPIAKLATYIGKTRPVFVLDLQKEHDLYTLKRLQPMFPHSELRLCEVRPATGREVSCRFVG